MQNVPLEIHHAILNNFNTKQELKQVSMVCRSWNLIVQPRLFRKITIFLEEYLDTGVYNALTQFSLRAGERVHHLIIKQSVSDISVDEDVMKDVLNLPHFPVLETLTLSDIRANVQRYIINSSMHILPIQMATRLNLLHCRIPFQQIALFISSFPNLHSLHIAGSGLIGDRAPVIQPPHFPHLLSIRIYFTDCFPYFVRWISTSNTPLAVRTLSLCILGDELGSLSTLYSRLAPTVECLDLMIALVSAWNFPFPFNRQILQPNPQLTSLVLRSAVQYHVPYFLSHISSESPTCLRSIRFTLPPFLNGHASAYHKLVMELTPDRHPYLEEVIFAYSGEPETLEGVRRNLEAAFEIAEVDVPMAVIRESDFEEWYDEHV